MTLLLANSPCLVCKRFFLRDDTISIQERNFYDSSTYCFPTLIFFLLAKSCRLWMDVEQRRLLISVLVAGSWHWFSKGSQREIWIKYDSQETLLQFRHTHTHTHTHKPTCMKSIFVVVSFLAKQLLDLIKFSLVKFQFTTRLANAGGTMEMVGSMWTCLHRTNQKCHAVWTVPSPHTDPQSCKFGVYMEFKSELRSDSIQNMLIYMQSSFVSFINHRRISFFLCARWKIV